MKRFERVVAALTVAACVAWAAYVVLIGSDTGITVPGFLVMTWGGLAILALSISHVILHLIVTRREREKRLVMRVLLPSIACVMCFALVTTGAAFWIRFQLSKSALTRYAQSASPATASGVLNTGVRVGLFRVQEAEALPRGVVRMITTHCMFDDCGLVYSPSGAPPVIGEDLYDPLGGPWFHWWRSW